MDTSGDAPPFSRQNCEKDGQSARGGLRLFRLDSRRFIGRKFDGMINHNQHLAKPFLRPPDQLLTHPFRFSLFDSGLSESLGTI